MKIVVRTLELASQLGLFGAKPKPKPTETQRVVVKPHVRQEKSGKLTQVKQHEATRAKAVEVKKPEPAEEVEIEVIPTIEYEPRDVLILARNAKAFEERLEKLAARAKKLGVEPPTWERGEQRLETWRGWVGPDPFHGREVTVKRQVIPYTISTKPVKLDGWRLAARKTPKDQDRPAKLSVVGWAVGELPARFRKNDTHCEHCKKKRARGKVFVVEKDGKYKQVGGECVKDYLGRSPDSAVGVLSFWSDVNAMLMGADERDWDEEREPREVSHLPMSHDIGIETLDVLTSVAKLMEDYGGYHSRAAEDMGEGIATSRLLREVMLEGVGMDAQKHRQALQALRTGVAPDPSWKRAREKAETVLAWLHDLPEQPIGSYLDKVRTAAAGTFAEDDELGILGSAIVAYDRAMTDQERKREEKARKESANAAGHFGKVGEKFGTGKKHEHAPRVVECTFAYSKDGIYGTTTITKLRDKDGHVFTWFASDRTNVPVSTSASTNGIYLPIAAGQKYVIAAGTIKAHDEYRGEDNTIITRAKLIPLLSEDEYAQHLKFDDAADMREYQHQEHRDMATDPERSASVTMQRISEYDEVVRKVYDKAVE